MVEVVKFVDAYSQAKPVNTKIEEKLKRSGKPLSLAEMKKKQAAAAKAKLKATETTSKDDIELNRLLNESTMLHNLKSNYRGYSGASLSLETLEEKEDLNLIGAARVRTLNSRISSISQTNSTAKEKLEKMPMSFRQGMIRHHLSKQAKYESDASESGIVLSKRKRGELRVLKDGGFVAKDKTMGDLSKLGGKVGKTAHTSGSRQRGLKINSIGRKTGGNSGTGIFISKKEMEKVVGTGSRGGRGGGRGRGRGGSRGGRGRGGSRR